MPRPHRPSALLVAGLIGAIGLVVACAGDVEAPSERTGSTGSAVTATDAGQIVVASSAATSRVRTVAMRCESPGSSGAVIVNGARTTAGEDLDATATTTPSPAATDASGSMSDKDAQQVADGGTNPVRTVSAVGDRLFVSSTPNAPSNVSHPADARGEVALADVASGMSLGITRAGAVAAEAAATEAGDLLYSSALDGADLIVRAEESGFEDIVPYAARPSKPELDYSVRLANGVAGLRLVANTLEFVDAQGAPRLRVAPPSLLDAGCQWVEAHIEVIGCAVDTEPRAPWGRPVVAPGASRCTVRVSWPASTTYPATLDPLWQSTNNNLSPAVYHHAAALLDDGQVLICGGLYNYFYSIRRSTNAAELYDPTTRTFAATAAMPTSRYKHTVTKLRTGDVLAVGGYSNAPGTSLTSTAAVDRYSPTWGTWTTLRPGLTEARGEHTADLLADGTLIVAGGDDSAGTYRTSSERYDPVAGTWSLQTLSAPRSNHASALLADGRELLAGGDDATHTGLTTTDLFTPSSGTWTAGPTMNLQRNAQVAVTLPSGKVLVMGGATGPSTATSTSELYDPTGGQNGTWTYTTNSMSSARYNHAAGLLGNGQVIVAGGDTGSGATASADLYTPSANGWAATAALTRGRILPTLTVIGGGQVLVTGGLDSSGPIATAETLDLCATACDDGNPCTTDACGTGATCVHTNLPSGSSCGAAQTCSSGGHTCDAAGTCVTGSPPVIDDGNECTDDACANDVVTHTSRTGQSCVGDGNQCYTHTCDGNNVCQAVAKPIDDSNPCTTDSCDPATGVHNVNLADYTPCSDGNVCNGAEYCLLDPGAQHSTCHPGTALPNNVVSADGCTEQICDSSLGVHSVPVASPPAYCSATANLAASGSEDPALPSSIASGGAAFLYTGSAPSQTMPDPSVINAQHAAIIRGRVVKRDGSPLAGVTVTVLRHAEFGSTMTRDDGWFDVVVNGGAAYVLDYAPPGDNAYVHGQRHAVTQWGRYTVVDDFAVTPIDRPTTVNRSVSGYQAAQGSLATDANGASARTATVLFPDVQSDGTPATITATVPGAPPWTAPSQISVHATELTSGTGAGVASMPGELPTTSGYNYAVDLQIDGVPANATEIDFNPAVSFYVENFVGLPVGWSVPTGFYDTTGGAWVASDNVDTTNNAIGRVIKILSITGGMVDLDVDGNAQPASSAELTALHITDAERTKLASMYAVGTELWRTQMPHFSRWDLNWGLAPPNDAIDPPNKDPIAKRPAKNPSLCPGSIIECENEGLAEELPIAGTPFSLRYESDRVRGRFPVASIPITDTRTLPADLSYIRVEVEIAGHRDVFIVPSPYLPNQAVDYYWDRTDAYGRPVQGPQWAAVAVGYVYKPIYTSVSRFGYSGNGSSVTALRDGREITLWHYSNVQLGGYDAQPLGLGGWMLSGQHVYDADAHEVLTGDGRSLSPGATTPGVISSLFTGPTGATIFAHAVAPNGDLYYGLDNRVYKRTSAGVVTLVAGTGSDGTAGDGGPATAAQLTTVFGLAFAPDGSLYVSCKYGAITVDRVRRVDVNGVITTVAGGGSSTSDDVPATQEMLSWPGQIAIAPDGTVYVAEGGTSLQRLLEITTQGRLRILATDASGGVALSPKGDVFYGAGTRLKRLTPSGTVTTVAGGGSSTGDGVAATAAAIGFITAVAVGADGIVYFADTNTHTVRAVANGVIRTVAGRYGVEGDSYPGGTAATDATFSNLESLAIGPDGYVQIVDACGFQTCNNILQIKPALSSDGLTDTTVADPDAGLAYIFDASGRHKETHSALRGELLQTLNYDSNALLSTITDGHESAGVPPLLTVSRLNCTSPARCTTVQLTGRLGETTTLTMDDNGYLSQFADPASASAHPVQITMDVNGLLTGETDGNLNAHSFGYTPAGRLATDTSPLGVTTLTRTEGTTTDITADAWTILRTSPANRGWKYTVDRTVSSSYAQRRTTIDPAGLTTTDDTLSDDGHHLLLPDGTIIQTSLKSDPRFGAAGAYVSSYSLTTPAGRHLSRTESRTTVPSAPSPFVFTSETTTVTLNGQHTFTTVVTPGAATVTRTSAVGRQTTTTLDAMGNPIQIHVAGTVPGLSTTLADTSLHYDGVGRLDNITQGARTAIISYDPTTGRISTVTDALGRVTSFDAFDANGRPTSWTLPGGHPVSMGYDGDGNVSSVTPPGRPAHTLIANGVDMLGTYSPPSVGFTPKDTTYTYDGERLLTAEIQPVASGMAGYTIARDPATGRVLTISHALGSASLTYDGLGRVWTNTTSSPDSVGLAYGYDGSLLTSEAVSGLFSHTFAWTYDDYLHVTQRTIDGGNAVTYGYDADGLLSTAGAMTLDHGASGAKNAMLGSATLTAGANTVVDTYAYNTFGELTDITTTSTAAPSNPVYAVHYDRDTGGRVKVKTETIGTNPSVAKAYDYDTEGRLWHVYPNGDVNQPPEETYTYDANGNRQDGTYSTDTPNDLAQDRQTTSADGRTFTYSYNGELATSQLGGATTTYAYDAFGNLRSVVRPSPASRIDYVIDGENRRVGKKLGGALTQGFLYSGSSVVAELDANGAIVSSFVYGSRPNVPDYMVRGTTTYRLVADQVGSVRLVVNAATGAIAQQIDYDGWGNITYECSQPAGGGACVTTNPPFQPFGFAGGLQDRDTGFVRFGARDYDPSTGRWTSKDRTRFSGGLNLYGYCYDDPINFFDRTGFGPEGAAVGAYAGALIGGYLGFQWGSAGGAVTGSGGGAIGIGAGVGIGGVGGAIAGAGIGGFAGAVIGSSVQDGLKWVADFAARRRGGRPNGCPVGTRPIDQAGLDREKIHGIKAGAGVPPDGWTGVDEDGNVWVDDGTGNAINVGHVDDF